MNYLIITDDESFSKEIKSVISKTDEAANYTETNFEEKNILAVSNTVQNIFMSIRYKSNDYEFINKQLSVTAFISGILSGKNRRLVSNFDIFDGIDYIPEQNFYLFETKAKIKKFLKDKLPGFLEEGKKEIARKELLDRGIPITPNCLAIYLMRGKTDICEMFLTTGININSKDELGTPLLNVAVRAENLEYVKRFLEMGAELNAISQDRGYTALMDAVQAGNAEITEYLIKQGAELNTISKEGQSNLVLAVGANQKKICQLLAENGADPDIKDQMGMSAYQYATLFKKAELVEILKPYHKE